MTKAVEQTSVQNRLNCGEKDCKKNFKTQGTMMQHKDKFHKIVNALSQSPLANSVRILFNGESEEDISQPSTQGDSNGTVNSPKVVTEGRFLCDECQFDSGMKVELEKHKSEQHDKSKDASNNDTDNDLNGSRREEDVLLEAVKEVDRDTVANIVNAFVDTAFQHMNRSEVLKSGCHECKCKDEVLEENRVAIIEKDLKLDEKSATIVGLMTTAKNAAVAKAAADKRVTQAESMKQKLVDKTKEVEILKAEVKTKDAIIALLKAEGEQSGHEEVEVVEEEIQIVNGGGGRTERKICKKCKFTAENMQVLELHVENDHQGNLFECEKCNKKFPFKNQLKLHRRQDHEEGTFACFVCNDKFRTHKDLKQHMQRKCKSPSRPAVRATSQRENEDILPEDEYRCIKCDKVTNNQVSLLNHMKEKHQTVANAWTGNKCITCGKEFEARDSLVKHIADTHIQNNNIVNRHICVVCNVEVHGDETRDGHMCRKPEHTCSFCQIKFYSQEARKNHICSAHQFKTMEQQAKSIERKNIPCRWGDSCFRASRGRCWFKHSRGINTIPPQGPVARLQGAGGQRAEVQGAGGQGADIQGHGFQDPGWHVVGHQGPGRQGAGHHGGGRQGARQQHGGKSTLWCRFQDKCLRRASCKFSILTRVFTK